MYTTKPSALACALHSQAHFLNFQCMHVKIGPINYLSGLLQECHFLCQTSPEPRPDRSHSLPRWHHPAVPERSRLHGGAVRLCDLVAPHVPQGHCWISRQLQGTATVDIIAITLFLAPVLFFSCMSLHQKRLLLF